MGYVLNLQAQKSAGPADAEPQSVWSTASGTAACVVSTVSMAACLGGSTLSAAVCM
ncbi:hypothetical protein [Thermostaphylospora chromogena]|uniref:Uncharacterized protein n=1 Tax=Thermostaphylospora chromogena TaxID=35622 RepID=A0A1H1AAK8_9ACTN|nr:hypothetical protein [Thermostaphylospora chromogena]SDQ36674.1 hypothetical protein SAMN04489764_0403 [Thermostaphylospora chromogena]